MRETIITLDANDIFSVMNSSRGRLFSVTKISAAGKVCDAVKKVCSDFKLYFSENTGKISEKGDVVINITSPLDSKLSMVDVTKIFETIQRYTSGRIMWGYATDDTCSQLEIDVIFEMGKPA